MSDERRDVERKMVFDEEYQKSLDQKSVDVEGQSKTSMAAAAAAPTDQPLPRIFQMNIDCFDELFEWLSIRELLMLRQTCKRFKALADYYIRTFYPAFKLGRGKVAICDAEYYSNINQFCHLGPNLAKLVKELTFWNLIINEDQIVKFKAILGQIDTLYLQPHQIEGEFYESFFQYCPNVKHLSVDNICNDTIMGSDNKWMLRSYPQLEHVHFDDSDPGRDGFGQEIPELKRFFELNPNIRTFSANFHFLRENRRFLIGSTIKFDVLQIKGDCSHEDGMDDICALVNELHEQGFYQRLHIRPHYIYIEEDWNAIKKLPAVESMYLGSLEIPIILPPTMSCLKILGLGYGGDIEESEKFARSLMNVERLFIVQTSVSDLMPFIRCSAKLKEIRVDRFDVFEDPAGEAYLKNGLIDVAALNIEREHLAGACKQTIYVGENIFLATKWAGMPTKCALVEVKRKQSSE